MALGETLQLMQQASQKRKRLNSIPSVFVVMLCLSSLNSCVNAVFSARRGGRVVQVGLPLGHHANPRIPMARVAAWELELIGSHGMCATEVPALLQQVSDGFALLFA